MFSIQVSVASQTDAIRAAAVFAAMAVAWDNKDIPEAAPRRTRNSAKPDPVGQFDALAGAAGAKTTADLAPVAEMVVAEVVHVGEVIAPVVAAVEIAAVEPAEPAAEPAKIEAPASALEVPSQNEQEENIAVLRSIAQQRGVKWLQAIFAEEKVAKMSALSPEAVVKWLTVAQAEALAA